MDNDKILEVILSAIPYPQQIKNLDTSKKGCVWFSWRGEEYIVNKNLFSREIKEDLEVGSNSAIFLGELLRNRLHEMEN